MIAIATRHFHFFVLVLRYCIADIYLALLPFSFSHLLPNECQGSIGSILEACLEFDHIVLSSAITPARPPSALSLHSSDASSRAFLLPAVCSHLISHSPPATGHR